MAPRAKASIASKPSVQEKRASGGALKDYPGKVDRWKDCPPRQCKLCLQTTSTIDVQSPKGRPKYLHWVHKEIEEIKEKAQSKSKKKKQVETITRWVPSGQQCCSCYVTRRKVWPGFSATELCRLREAEKDVPGGAEEKFWAFRGDLVGDVGQLKTADSWGAPKRETSKVEQNINRTFKPGTFYPIWEFAEDRRLEAQTLDELVGIVQDRYTTYKIVVDSGGTVGVRVPDLKGGAYRYEDGATEFTEYRKREKHETADDAVDAFQGKCAIVEDEEHENIVCDRDHKNVQGVSSTVRDIWNEREKIANSAKEDDDFDMAPSQVVKYADTLRQGRHGDEFDCANAISEIVDGAVQSECRKLCRWVASAAKKTQQQNLLEVGVMFHKELGLSVDTHLQAFHYHCNTLLARCASQCAPSTEGGPAETTLVRPCRDRAWFEDSDNMPDNVCLLDMISVALSMLGEFSSQHGKLCAEASTLAKLGVELWKVSNYDITEKFTAVDQLRCFGDLFRRLTRANGDRDSFKRTNRCSAGYHVQLFVAKFDAEETLCRNAEKLVEEQLVKGGAHSAAILRELAALQKSLPGPVADMLVAAKVFQRAEDSWARIRSGPNAPGVEELNRILNEAEKNKDTLPGVLLQRSDINVAIRGLTQEFETAASIHVSKVDGMLNSCQATLQLCGGVLEAVPKWDFSTCPWASLSNDDPDPDIVMAGRGVLRAVQTWADMSGATQQLAQENSHQPDLLRSQLLVFKEGFSSGYYKK